MRIEGGLCPISHCIHFMLGFKKTERERQRERINKALWREGAVEIERKRHTEREKKTERKGREREGIFTVWALLEHTVKEAWGGGTALRILCYRLMACHNSRRDPISHLNDNSFYGSIVLQNCAVHGITQAMVFFCLHIDG